MNRNSRRLIIAAGMSIITCYTMPKAQAQRRNTRDSLQYISNKLLAAGNLDFLTVEAFRDGLLQPDSGYTISYEHGIVMVNGHEPAEPSRTRYKALMQRYLTGSGNPENLQFRTTSNAPATLQKILALGSATGRQLADEPDAKPTDYTPVVKALISDHIIRGDRDIRILYNKDGIVVNGMKLTGAIEGKYKDMYRTLFGFVQTGANSMSYSTTTTIGAHK